MARSIDTVDFDLFYGRVANLKTRSETWEIFGLDGVGVWIGGMGDADVQLRTVFYAENDSESEGHIEDCEALQGTIVTIVDAYGRSFDNCFIQHVDTENCEEPRIWNGNDKAVRVELRWNIKRVA